MTFQNSVNSYSGETDIFLVSGNPDYNPVSSPYAAAGSTSGFAWRSLFRFDLSSLAGQYSTISQIQFTLTLQNQSGSNTMNLEEVSAANSDWLYTTATWNNKNTNTPIAWDGGPGLGATGYGSVLDSQNWNQSTASVTFTISGAAATNLINDFTSGRNGGFFITSTDETGEGVFTQIGSGRSLAASVHPQLTVTYNPLPEPSSIFLLLGGAGLVGLRRVRRK